MSENMHVRMNGQGQADPHLNSAQFTHKQGHQPNSNAKAAGPITIKRAPKTSDLHYRKPSQVKKTRQITVTHTRQGLKGGKWVGVTKPRKRTAGNKGP